MINSMTRQIEIQPKSFKGTGYFPGTAGNPFDAVLQSTNRFAKLPVLSVFLILALLACLGGKFAWHQALILLAFFLADWLLLALLPKTQRSFGPIKPVLLMLAVLRTPFMLLPLWWGIAFELLGTMLVLYGFYFEPFHLDVHRETLLTDKLPAGTSLTIAHLGDLHIERLTRREEAILCQLKKSSPDMILFSGDILNLSYVNDSCAQQQAVTFLKALHAPMGVYGVTGSPPVDPPEVYRSITEGTPLRWLDDQIETIKFGESTIIITGLTCSHHPDEDYEKLQNIGFPVPGSNSINILLYHSPDIAPLVQQEDFDLQFSGHTHGGQVRLPFYGAIFAASLYHKAFEAGRYFLGKMTLYVTRGLGMEGGIAPRVRFLCRPELILWEIKGI